MKKSLRYFSFALVLGIAGLAFLQCSKSLTTNPILTENQDELMLSAYVSIEGLSYRLNITEAEALKLGVSSNSFKDIESRVAFINSTIEKQLEEDPDAIITLTDPGEIAEDAYLPILKSISETPKSFSGYISYLWGSGESSSFSWSSGNDKIQIIYDDLWSQSFYIDNIAISYRLHDPYSYDYSEVSGTNYNCFANKHTSTISLPLPDQPFNDFEGKLRITDMKYLGGPSYNLQWEDIDSGEVYYKNGN